MTVLWDVQVKTGFHTSGKTRTSTR